MLFSLSEFSRENYPVIDPVLISAKNLNSLIKCIDYFPNAIASIFGFECVLNNPTATIDFFFCIRSREKYYNLLDRNSQLLDNFIWRNIIQFYQMWQDEQTVLAKKIEDVWLEFDCEQYSNKIPIPSIFFAATQINSQAEWQWMIDNYLSQLLGDNISPDFQQLRSQVKLLLQIISQLPKNVAIFQVGLLLSRPQKNIRIYTTAITINQICNYLTKLNWQGDIDLLVNILGRISSLVDKYQLQIEIGHKLSDTIAIEFYCYNQTNLQSLLEYLSITGFCLPEKRDALLAFPNLSTDFSRRIAYLKMTYTPNNPLQFKAYLGITSKIQQ